jgi:hypothetical protein
MYKIARGINMAISGAIPVSEGSSLARLLSRHHISDNNNCEAEEVNARARESEREKEEFALCSRALFGVYVCAFR